MNSFKIYIGCAGWNIPKDYKKYFPEEGTHLIRYAHCFNAVEINSSFYRSHKPSTYAKWSNSVHDDFQFSVKIPKQITHQSKLVDPSLLDRFLEEANELGEKLGPLLVQLPPSLSFDAETVENFFSELRQRFTGKVVCEPRHESWFTEEPEQVFSEYKVARVAADPPTHSPGDRPAGWNGLAYFRFHGSPKKYYSTYTAEHLGKFAKWITEAAQSAETWCIFDNTSAGAATINALDLVEKLNMK